MLTPVTDDFPSSNEEYKQDAETESLHCNECSVDFTSEYFLLNHLLHHIKQPSVLLHRIQAPIKLTFKVTSDNKFEIISSPTRTAGYQLTPDYLAEDLFGTDTANSEFNTENSSIEQSFDENSLGNLEGNQEESMGVEESGELANISFSPNYANDVLGNSPALTEESNSNIQSSPLGSNDSLSGEIPGAEPTPPPESPSSTEYPKIRIKTTGLLKEPLTITEITDDNPDGEYRPAEVVDISNSTDTNTDTSNFWNTSLEDPLKLPDSDKDDNSLLSSFLNSSTNDQAKAFGITTENEFISLDRLDDRNRGALQVYNPSNAASTANSLESLTGLPMQQLAEQVSRLQPSGSNGGMHQQNVLINIQQFPQAPPPQPHSYQHPPMYPQHPPHPGMPSQPPPMYQPYQYQLPEKRPI